MSGICNQPVCDTTEEVPVNPEAPVEDGCCLPHNAVWTNATIRTDEKGCIYSIESGTPLVYTPDPCCPATSTTGGGAGLDGPPGPAGQSATITVGTVSASAPGTQPQVVNVGTSTAAILNFTIPEGDPGNDGITTTGVTSELHGYKFLNGVVKELPTAWPPITGFNPSLVTNNGVSLQFSKVGASISTTVDASVLAMSMSTGLATTNATVAALTITLSTAQLEIATLSTALSTAVSRIDAAGIP